MPESSDLAIFVVMTTDNRQNRIPCTCAPGNERKANNEGTAQSYYDIVKGLKLRITVIAMDMKFGVIILCYTWYEFHATPPSGVGGSAMPIVKYLIAK